MAQEIKQSKCAEYITVEQQTHKHFHQYCPACSPLQWNIAAKRSTFYRGYFDLSRGIIINIYKQTLSGPFSMSLVFYKSGVLVETLVDVLDIHI